MADEPFFPPPKPRGAYREPQERPVVPDIEPAPEPEKPKRVFASRADQELRDASKKHEQLEEILKDGFKEERAFWFHKSFVVNHPRITGALFLVPGLFFTALAYDTMYHRFRSYRGSGIGPTLLAVGLLLLIFGFPIDRTTGRLPVWWTTVAAFVFLGDMLLTFSILRMR